MLEPALTALHVVTRRRAVRHRDIAGADSIATTVAMFAIKNGTYVKEVAAMRDGSSTLRPCLLFSSVKAAALGHRADTYETAEPRPLLNAGVRQCGATGETVTVPGPISTGQLRRNSAMPP